MEAGSPELRRSPVPQGAAGHAGRACSTEGRQILARIVAGLAAKFFVMNIEIDIAPEDWHPQLSRRSTWFAELFVRAGAQAATEVVLVRSNSRYLLGDLVQKHLSFFAGEELEKT
jgi:hypothetical protein